MTKPLFSIKQHFIGYWYVYLPVVSVLVFLGILGYIINAHSVTNSSKDISYKYSQPSPTPFIKPNLETQKWLMAAGAMLAVRNGEPTDRMESNLTNQEVKDLLLEWWGIRTRDEALRTLNELKASLHGRQFRNLLRYIMAVTQGDENTFVLLKNDIRQKLFMSTQQDADFLLDFTWAHRFDLKEKQLLAWDYVRLINVARWSYNAGLITEREAWERSLFAGRELQKTYSSWEELGKHYLIGRTFWNYQTTHPEIEYAIRILNQKGSGLWNQIGWGMKLE